MPVKSLYSRQEPRFMCRNLATARFHALAVAPLSLASAEAGETGGAE